jgi:hypothetical protein
MGNGAIEASDRPLNWIGDKKGSDQPLALSHGRRLNIAQVKVVSGEPKVGLRYAHTAYDLVRRQPSKDWLR